jgi:hypothetical protein
MKTEDGQIGWIFSKYVSITTAPTSTSAASPAIGPGAECDASLWGRVYHPQRLIVQKQCTEVTAGVIVDATDGKNLTASVTRPTATPADNSR